jgi:hypothetical protein
MSCRTKKIRIALPFVLIALASASRFAQDTVALASGKELEGRVVYEDDKELVLRVGSRDRVVALTDVSAVDARMRHLRAFLRLLGTLDRDSAAHWAELAQSAAAVGLAEESQLAWLKSLSLDPERDDAHTALGHNERNGTWTVKHGGKYLTWPRYLEAHEAWTGAWELGTTHFALRSNLELGVAIDAAFDLELAYARFYDLLATELRLLDITEPMKAEVHGREGSFRLRTPGEAGWFDRVAETMLVDASPDPESYDRGLLYHEVTHELFYFTTRQGKRNRGSLPAWLNEGMAEYVASRARDGDGHVLPFAERRHVESFKRHAEAKEPIALGRLLNLGVGEFSVGADLRQRYAQCYTLVHFLLEGEQESWRAGFLEFVRSAYASKSSSTHLWKALDAKQKVVEGAWHAHARTTAAAF